MAEIAPAKSTVTRITGNRVPSAIMSDRELGQGPRHPHLERIMKAHITRLAHRPACAFAGLFAFYLSTSSSFA